MPSRRGSNSLSVRDMIYVEPVCCSLRRTPSPPAMPVMLKFFVVTLLSTCAASISLTAPTADVLLSTSIDCAWSATPPDPVSFRLAVQYGVNFTQIALASIVHRGNDTSGTVENVATVNILGPHRLAAFADPYDDQLPPLAVSTTFQVVSSSGSSPSSSSIIPSSTTNPRSPSKISESRKQMIIGVSLGTCAALGLLILAYCFLLRRRKARRGVSVGSPVRAVSPFLLRTPVVTGSEDSSSAPAAPTRGAEGLNARNEAPPPYVSGF
ncbi:hypothetical protein C8R46DRAFT_1065472 [Mycena filopes]|nr:hypothetical protein C8R46DRAFT_1065472 [Mycena filopes]